MPLIVLGVSLFGGLLALLEIIRNKKLGTASTYREEKTAATVIYLPANIELEKIRRKIF